MCMLSKQRPTHVVSWLPARSVNIFTAGARSETANMHRRWSVPQKAVDTTRALAA